MANCPQFLVSLIFVFFRSSSFVYLSYKWRRKSAKIRDTKHEGQLADRRSRSPDKLNG